MIKTSISYCPHIFTNIYYFSITNQGSESINAQKSTLRRIPWIPWMNSRRFIHFLKNLFNFKDSFAQCISCNSLAQTPRHLSRLLRNGPNCRRHQTTVDSSSGLAWLVCLLLSVCTCNKHNNTKWLLMHAKAKHSAQWQKLSAYEHHNYPLHDPKCSCLSQFSHFPRRRLRRLAVSAEPRFMAHSPNGLQQQLAAVSGLSSAELFSEQVKTTEY